MWEMQGLELLGASLAAQLVKNPPAMQETWFDFWMGKIPPFQYSWASLATQTVKNVCLQWGTWVWPWFGKIPWRDHGNPLQYSCLENPYGQSSLAGYSPWGFKELEMAERLSPAWKKCSTMTVLFYIFIGV